MWKTNRQNSELTASPQHPNIWSQGPICRGAIGWIPKSGQSAHQICTTSCKNALILWTSGWRHRPSGTQLDSFGTGGTHGANNERVKQVLDYCLPKDGEPIKLNGAYHTLCSILRFVVASAAEAELGALLLNCQEGMIFKATLEDLDHPQPKIPVHCNNATAVRIANNTIKRQRSWAMEMRWRKNMTIYE